ncbi:MAG: hypothetical protein AAFV30_06060, partial [Pseudomonadota bacterium]
RLTLQRQALMQLARTDETQALDLARASGDTALVDSVLSNKLVTLASKDPEAALAQLDGISSASIRQELERSMMRQYAARNPEGVRERLDAMPPGAGRDGAILGLVNVPTTAPTDALDLVEEIGDPTLRRHAQSMLVMRVARDDPGEAQRMMDEMDLPEVTRQQLNRVISQGGSPFLR